MTPRDYIALIRAEVPMFWEKCDSPIEDDFLWEFQKVAQPGLTLRPQHLCPGRGRKEYRIDFAVFGDQDHQRIGIECDGRDYHQSSTKDAQRDVEIVESGALKKVYRIPGFAIHWHVHDVLDLLSTVEPWMFSERGRDIINARAAQEHLRTDTRGYMTDTNQGAIWREVDYPQAEDEEDQQYFRSFTIRWTPR